jgi:hypothetical protein
MTLEQMAAIAAPQKCEALPLQEPVYQTLDYAMASNLSLRECMERLRCPVCGGTTKKEIDMAHQEISYFWCNKSSKHVFEQNDDLDTIDRIEM